MATDLKRIEAVIDVVGDGSLLAVDANGKFDMETAIAYAKGMKPYGLFWYEEAGDPLDYALQAELANHYDGPFATGENLFSHQDIRNLLRYGGLDTSKDWIMPDPALAMGVTEGLRIIQAAEAEGWPRRRIVLHGGTQLALSMAAGLQLGGTETYPLMFQPYGGFEDGSVIDTGYAKLPEYPGLGIEAKSRLHKIMSDVAKS